MMDNKENFTSDEEEVVILLDDDVVDIPVEAVEPAVALKEEKPSLRKASAEPVVSPRSKVTKVEIEDDSYDDDEDDEEDDDDDEGGILGGVFGKLLIVFGIAIAVLAIFLGVRFMDSNRTTAQKVDFSELGSSLMDESGLIGGGNVKAITDSQGQRMEMLQAIIENYEYDEVDEETGVTTVDVTLTTILKDLKIKFVNQKNNKLIAGVPFKVQITKPDGTSMEKADDDKDGIIYLSEIDGGAYTVKLDPIDGLEAYYDFTKNGSKSVNVKTQLDYKKVDVSNEVKKASDEVAKKEDTKQQETVEESKLKDTVTYVVSEKIQGSNGYEEINKSLYITDPIVKLQNSLKQAAVSRFKKLAEGDDTHEHDWFDSFSHIEGTTTHARKCTVEGCNEYDTSVKCSFGDWTQNEKTHKHICSVCGYEESEACSDADGDGKCDVCGLPYVVECAHPEDKLKYTANSDGQTHKITCECGHVVKESDPCVWGDDGKCTKSGCTNTKQPTEVSGSVTIKAKDSAGTEVTKLTLNKKDAAKNKGTLTATINFTTSGVDSSKFSEIKYTWESTDSSVLKVTGNGASANFEILKAGKATVNVKVECTSSDSGISNVTFTQSLPLEAAGIVIDVDADKKMVLVGEKIDVTFAVTGGVNNTLSYSLDPANAGGFAGVVPSENTRTCTITGLKPGTFSVTVTSKEDESVTKKITVYVYANPKTDTTTKLLTDQGKQVYIKNGDKYVEATVADYYKDTKFYVGGAATYTYHGWWTIDGKTYYFDANGKKVTGNQVILGAEYSFGSDGVLKSGNSSFGIDVSTWNGSIDWNKVSKSGVTYAIIRCGFRGSSLGGLYIDNKFENNIKNATAEGIKVGVYFFTQAITEAEAIEEASMCIGLVENYKLSYPIFLDVESSGGRADSLSKEARTAIIKAFCKTVTNAGYKAGVYANKNWFTTKINATELTEYTIWLAQYASAPSYTTTRYDMWQYSAKGSISGISGDVDLNISYIK